MEKRVNAQTLKFPVCKARQRPSEIPNVPFSCTIRSLLFVHLWDNKSLIWFIHSGQMWLRTFPFRHLLSYIYIFPQSSISTNSTNVIMVWSDPIEIMRIYNVISLGGPWNLPCDWQYVKVPESAIHTQFPIPNWKWNSIKFWGDVNNSNKTLSQETMVGNFLFFKNVFYSKSPVNNWDATNSRQIRLIIEAYYMPSLRILASTWHPSRLSMAHL